ncbi:hypothetical protein PMAYCL1PPCAC_08323, partial [Pristionchus mayeri]
MGNVTTELVINATSYFKMASGGSQLDAGELPIVFYEDPTGQMHSCSIDDVHSWLRDGYFTSKTKFILAPREADATNGEWRVWTLGELIARNGRSMPFLMRYEDETKKEVKTMNELSEEMADLTRRQCELSKSMRSL